MARLMPRKRIGRRATANPRVAAERALRMSTKRKFPPVICPNKCPGGTLDHRENVEPSDVGLDAIAISKLHPKYTLYHCTSCDCIWEHYRDHFGEWRNRTIKNGVAD
jgi:hypothetical protein